MGLKAWTNEDEEELKERYLTITKDVEELGEYFGKGYRSVISKLVNMGIYEKPFEEKKPNRTVKTMILDIERILDIRVEGFNLNKKSNLLLVMEALEAKIEELENQNNLK